MFATAGQVDAGMVELCEDALALIGPDDPRRVRILSTLASHLTFDHDRERRVSVLAEALELARADGRPELVGSVLVAEYLSTWDPTTVERRAEIAREVSRAARASGDADLRFFGGFFGAIGRAERCDVAAARAELVALRDAADATHNFYFRFIVDRYVLSIDILAGIGTQSEVDALAARYAETHADTDGTWSIQTGGLAFQAGAMAGLAPTLRAMVEASPVGSNWTAGYGVALVASGDLDGATAVLDGIDDPPCDYFWIVTMQSVAELVVLLGRTDRSPHLREALTPYRGQLGISASGSFCYGLVSLTLGQLALLEGDLDAAIELLEESVAVADAMPAPYESARARRSLAEARSAAGHERSGIDALLAEAAELAARHGFAGESAALARWTN
jgi:hypothetical protein